ncbi:hypothetical protein QBC42DRAFT_249517 [Cladorrhinum samala]|uniref:Uncharacterized protein n=1 Tax=Cladorrhinum samala TaxID=585594 RepID=A0AAV9HWK5_9PEZI|nr:hypothetical protein QBC42DRAFT_249517 [Cladorrhinum samala]
MARLLFNTFFFLPSVAYAAAMALHGGSNVRRAGLAVSTITSWAPPATVTVTETVNPSDIISWITFGTQIVYPYTQTTTITSGCVSYTHLYPPTLTPTATKTSPSVSQTTVTATRTTSVTVTETRTDRPTTTRYSVTFDTISETAGRTEYSTKCTNTMVRSFYVPTIYTRTQTQASVYTRTSRTEVCMVDSTRLATIPGVTQTREPYVPDWERFSGTVTVFTSHEPSASYEYVTVTADTAVSTEIICNNPRVYETQTYYTYTSTVGTTTIYASQTGCTAASTSAPPVQTPASSSTTASPSIPLVDREGVNDYYGDNTNFPVKAREEGEQEQQQTSSLVPPRTPASVYTTMYTTAILVNDTAVVSYTATAIVDVYTQTFTTISMVGATVTTTATKYSTVCSLPTSR